MIRRRHTANQKADLTASITTRVRFSEVDSMKVVWHGEYVRYFEDGREAFGRQYAGIGYLDIYESGYTAPIVDLQLHYLRSLTIGDEITIETHYTATDAAKLCFDYLIRRNTDGEIAATGSSVQVFLTPEGELSLTNPDFFEAWKKRWLSR